VSDPCHPGLPPWAYITGCIRAFGGLCWSCTISTHCSSFALTALRSVGPLDVLSSTTAEASVATPCQDGFEPRALKGPGSV